VIKLLKVTASTNVKAAGHSHWGRTEKKRRTHGKEKKIRNRRKERKEAARRKKLPVSLLENKADRQKGGGNQGGSTGGS